MVRRTSRRAIAGASLVIVLRFIRPEQLLKVESLPDLVERLVDRRVGAQHAERVLPALARELELPYAAICVVVNHAAGRADSADQISMESIAKVLESAMDRIHVLLTHLAAVAA